jgi:hypothetical protein
MHVRILRRKYSSLRLADFSPQRQRACAKRANSHASMLIGNQIGAAGSSLGLRAEAGELGNKSEAPDHDRWSLTI